MAKKVSLQMVADEAGCSVGVVSAVLNKGGEGVIRTSMDTQKRVVMVARKLGLKSSYSPHRVGVYAQHIESALPVAYSEVLSALVVQEAIKKGLAIETLSDEKLDPRLDAGLDGVIGVGWNKHLADLGGIPHFPVVTINQPMLDKCIHSVSSDHEQQAQLATEYGIEKGHCRIAILETQPDTWGYRERVRGYKSALKSARVAFDSELVGHLDGHDMENVLRRWVDKGVTLVLNFPAQQGLETVHTLTNVMGLRIGEDISVISLDDLPVFQYFHPPQTVIHQSLDKLAEAAVSLMVRLIEDPEEHPKPSSMDNVRFSAKVIERASVKDLT